MTYFELSGLVLTRYSQQNNRVTSPANRRIDAAANRAAALQEVFHNPPVPVGHMEKWVSWNNGSAGTLSWSRQKVALDFIDEGS